MGAPKRFRAWLIAAAVLAGLMAAIALAARSEPALRWAAGQATAWSGGRLVLEGVSGSVLGPLRVSRLLFRTQDMEYEALQVEADWQPLSALHAPLRVTRLSAQRLNVRVHAGGAPVRLPDDIGLPLGLRLSRIEVKHVVVAAPETEIPIEDVAGSASLGPGGYAVSLGSARFPWGTLAGEAKLEAARPFALSGRLQLAPAMLEGRTVPVAVSGTLEAVQGAGALELPWGSATASVLIAPFADFPWQSLKAELKDANPARARAGLPEASVEATLEASLDRGVLSGTLEAVNRLPGRLDQNRLPIERLSARLAGNPDMPRLEPLEMALPGGATLTGTGALSDHKLDLNLRTGGITLNALHRALKPLRLAGRFTLQATPEDQSIAAEFSSGEYRLTLDATRRADTVSIRNASLRARGSELRLEGESGLEGERAFAGSGVFRQFDPSLWGDFPSARINAQLHFTGKLLPQAEASVRYRIVDSAFRAAPLSGEGTLVWSQRGVVRADGFLALGENRATFAGALGGPDERLAWALDAPALRALGKEFAGKLNASGWLAGALERPDLEFELRGTDLRVSGLAAGSIEGKAKLAPSAEGILAVRLSARELRAGGLALSAVEAEAAGTIARHSLSLDARGPSLDLRARLEGGLEAGMRWSGSLAALDADRPYALRLAAPASLELAVNEMKIGAAELSFAGGRILLQEFQRRPGLLRNRGHFEAIPLAALVAGPRWQSTLILSGAWDLDAAENLRGSLRVVRERGDIVLTGARTVPLGLSQLSLEARAGEQGFEAVVSAQGDLVGTLSGRVEARAERTEAGWRIAPDAPLRGQFKASIPSLAWLGPLADPLLATAGVLELDASVAGTARTPSIQGRLTGQMLEAHVDTAGLHLTDGVLEAAFTGDRLEVQTLKFRGGGGELTAGGSATFSEGERRASLEFRAQKLTLVELPRQILEASGTGRIEMQGKLVAITGALRADRGVIETSELERPRLSDDVVIVGRERPAVVAAPSALRIALDLDFGDDFRVKGSAVETPFAGTPLDAPLGSTGLEARLAGTIALRSLDGVTRAKGVVRVAEGSYTAYGQRLAIERGSLLFDGPITNPTLDILAMRKNQQVEVGFAITGTALSPRVRLVSRPEVPEQEKVSWLVLGQGTGGREDSAFSVPGFTTRKEDYLSLGAQLTSTLHMGIGRSLLGTGTLLKLTYILSEKWSVRASSGDVNGLSILYTINFE